MALLPPTKRLVPEDYPTQMSWIEQLLQPLNQFLESTVAALNRGLTLNQNLDAQVLDITVTTTAGSAAPVTLVPVTTKSRPTAVLIGNCRYASGNGTTAAVFPLWEYLPASRQIKINTIYGLGASTKYTLTLVIFTS